MDGGSVMRVLERSWGRMHWRVDGGAGPTVVFANSLGTDLRVWDPLLPCLPTAWRIVRFDKRGHGLSERGGEASVEDHAEDAAAVIEAVGQGPVAFVGLSVGGLIGQALAAARPDLVAALVLSNSAARVGTPEFWQARIDAVEGQGLASIADGIMERWFSASFRATPNLSPWRTMLARTDAEGYAACCRALARADLTASTARLRLPVLAVAGTEDGATPPDLVRVTADLVPGARFALIEGVGHIPPVEAPEAMAAHLVAFLREHLDA